jgi:hypothetical protein
MDRECFPASPARRDETRGCVVEWSDAVGRSRPVMCLQVVDLAQQAVIKTFRAVTYGR